MGLTQHTKIKMTTRKFYNKIETAGSPLKEIFPVLGANEIYHSELLDLELYFPLDYIEVANRTDDHLIYFLDSTRYSIAPNETLDFDEQKFRSFRIEAGPLGTNSDLTKWDLRIVVKKKPMDSDKYNKLKYESSQRPFNKLKRFFR